VSHVDVVPTLLELAVSDLPADVAGTSLVPLVEHDGPARAFAFGQLTYHTYFDPKRSVRSADAKLILNLSNAPRAMDPTQSWMHRSVPIDLTGPTIGTSPVMEFYDLATDPDELVNLIDDPDRTAQVSEFAAALHHWMRETADPLLTNPTSPRHAIALAGLERTASAHRDAPAAIPL
jgi:N-sulfoglucosamine sulfohydrolase